VSIPNLVQYALFLAVVTLLVRPLGAYLARVFQGQNTWLDPGLRPLERAIYRVCGVDAIREMDWRRYAASFVLFSLFGTILLFLILLVQRFLPWFFAQYMTTPMTPDLALNVAVSFATTTTWQAYAGETTMSYLSQMVGLAAQNFLAGAAGLAIGIAFIRGFARQETRALGNFWVDVTRASLWVLLPISLVGAVVLVWQGVPMNWQPYVSATTVEGGPQVIAQGPIAALEPIKNLGTNGGGFFNVNGAHPYENPTPLTGFLETLAIVALPAALTNTFGRFVGRTREGWVLFGAMAFLFALGLVVCGWAEQAGNPRLGAATALDANVTPSQAGGNMEGKETRFGIGASVLTAVATSNGATGSYNSMHDSYTPIGGMVPLVNMLLGELIFGGLGTGIYSILVVALLGLFLTGLMVGRTPQYLGKRLVGDETKLIMFYLFIGIVAILVPTSLAVATEAGRVGLTTNDGPHGFTSILFAFTSSTANNGQNFAGLSANSVFYNLTTALSMLLGRFGLAIFALALAGQLARQIRRPPSIGTLPTASVTFGVVIVATILIVGALSYFPALGLGPLVEQLRLFTTG
jgi:K+-transporting ATPase ATPase A chain